MDIDIDLDWFKQNRFWGGSILAGIVLLLAFGYVWMTTGGEISDLKSQKKTKIDELKVASNKAKSKNLVDVYRKKEQNYARQTEEIVGFYLQGEHDIERWFGGNRSPKTGEFKGNYLTEKRTLMDKLSNNGVSILPEDVRDPNNITEEQKDKALGWSDTPGTNMEQNQKRFWITTRIINDVIEANVNCIVKIEHTGFGKPTTLKKIKGLTDSRTPARFLVGNYGDGRNRPPGRILVEKFRTNVTVQLYSDQIGTLLTLLHNWNRDQEEVPKLMSKISSYKIEKVRTTTGKIDSRQTVGTFEIPTNVLKENWDNWNHGGLEALADVTPSFNKPPLVECNISLVVYDFNDKTMMDVLKLTGRNKDDIFSLFQKHTPLTDQDLNELW